MDKRGYKDEEDEEDFRQSDLEQENNVLRQELSGLYDQLLSVSSQNRRQIMKVSEVQTHNDLALEIPHVKYVFDTLKKELAYSKSLNAEQATKGKEMEEKVRNLEVKLLELNLQLLQTGPIKAKVAELVKTSETLQSKLNSSMNESINLQIEIDHHKGTIGNLSMNIDESNIDKAKKDTQIDELKEEIQEYQKRLDEKSAQHQAALSLNEEYQAKLHQDDIKFIDWRGELNQWERKCESQGREIYKLAEELNKSKDHYDNELRRRKIHENKLQRQIDEQEQQLFAARNNHYVKGTSNTSSSSSSRINNSNNNSSSSKLVVDQESVMDVEGCGCFPIPGLLTSPQQQQQQQQQQTSNGYNNNNNNKKKR